MPHVSLSLVQARDAAAQLDSLVESRIDLALTPTVLTRLALRGVTESAARAHLRKSAAAALVAGYSA